MNRPCIGIFLNTRSPTVYTALSIVLQRNGSLAQGILISHANCTRKCRNTRVTKSSVRCAPAFVTAPLRSLRREAGHVAVRQTRARADRSMTTASSSTFSAYSLSAFWEFRLSWHFQSIVLLRHLIRKRRDIVILGCILIIKWIVITEWTFNP